MGARYSVSGRSTVTPTTVRAGVSLFSTTVVIPKLREVYVFNTTTTGFVVSLTRFTNATGVGAGLTEVPHAPYGAPTAVATAFAGHTADGAVSDEIVRASVGAAVGAGAIWTFDSEPVECADKTTASGLGLVCPTGTGQVFDYTLIWEE